MGQMCLVLGGARSGKSRIAERLAEAEPPVFYLATATGGDAEFERRIRLHRERRPTDWRTIEAPPDLAGAFATHGGAGGTLLVECVTLWVSQLLLEDPRRQPGSIPWHIAAAIEAGRRTAARVIWVSSEVGAGIVPDNPLAREFRDVLGEVNQHLAEASDHVFFCVAGIATQIK